MQEWRFKCGHNRFENFGDLYTKIIVGWGESENAQLFLVGKRIPLLSADFIGHPPPPPPPLPPLLEPRRDGPASFTKQFNNHN